MAFQCPYCNSNVVFPAKRSGNDFECQQRGTSFVSKLSAHQVPRKLFLDIETTGFRPSCGVLTTIVWCGDGAWGYWVNDGMSIEPFLAAWTNSKELITYNGRSFDEPWLIEALNFPPHKCHNDLRGEASSRGLTGGLKLITQELGISRPPELDEMEGKHAVKLWNSFCKGNKCSLCNLIYYNAWDVVLTYQLYCYFNGEVPDRIQDSMPFVNNAEALYPFLKPCSRNPEKRHAEDAKPITELWRERRHSPLTSLQGAVVCFTGDLSRYEREEAEALVWTLGGIVKKSSVKRLDFLIVGDTGKYGKTSKITQAEGNIKRGAHTKILNEAEFLELVHGTKK